MDITIKNVPMPHSTCVANDEIFEIYFGLVSRNMRDMTKILNESKLVLQNGLMHERAKTDARVEALLTRAFKVVLTA